MNGFARIFERYLVYLFLVIMVCACSKEEEPLPLTADFTYEIDPAEPGRIRFINKSKSAMAYQWNFGDGSDQFPITASSKFSKHPMHIYYINDTFEVTLTTFSSKNNSGKLSGTLGGLGKKCTKQIIVTHAIPIFSAKITPSWRQPFIFSAIDYYTYTDNKTLEIIVYDGSQNSIRLTVPNTAATGSTYTINQQTPTPSDLRIKGYFSSDSYNAPDYTCTIGVQAVYYGNISFKNISNYNIQGSVSGLLQNCTVRSVLIEDGEFNLPK